jgi:hypothetical protein
MRTSAAPGAGDGPAAFALNGPATMNRHEAASPIERWCMAGQTATAMPGIERPSVRDQLAA